MEIYDNILERAEKALRPTALNLTVEETAGVLLRMTEAAAQLTGSTNGSELATYAVCQAKAGGTFAAGLKAYLLDRAPAILRAPAVS